MSLSCGNIEIRKVSYFLRTWRGIYNFQYHKQHCIIQFFGQFCTLHNFWVVLSAIYMQNQDDLNVTLPQGFNSGFESKT